MARQRHTALGAGLLLLLGSIGSSWAQEVTETPATHDHAARMREVVAMLDDADLDRLLGTPVPFAEFPALMSNLYAGTHLSPVPLIAYAG